MPAAAATLDASAAAAMISLFADFRFAADFCHAAIARYLMMRAFCCRATRIRFADIIYLFLCSMPRDSAASARALERCCLR